MLSNIKRIANVIHCNIYTRLCHLYMKTALYRMIKKMFNIYMSSDLKILH